MRRRSLELPVDELEERVARAQERLRGGQRALDEAAETIRAETAALKARVRQDLAAFTEELAAALPGADRQGGGARRAALPGSLHRGHLEALAGGRGGDAGRASSRRLAERVIQVANENAAEVTQQVADELGGGRGAPRDLPSTPSSTTPRCSRWARWAPRCSCS